MKHLNEAKPYADAAFLFAKEHKQMDLWRHFLKEMAKVLADVDLQNLIKTPQVTATMLVDILIEAYGKSNAEMNNFLKLLSENQRINILPEINELFEQAWQKDQHIAEVTLTFAQTPTDADIASLAPVLKIKFGNSIKQNIQVDAKILSGVVITSGDCVIDASLRGQLENLKTELMRA